jgi:hypothetical protein
VAQQTHIGDGVRAGDHARNQRPHLRPSGDTSGARHRQVPIGQLLESSVSGQRHRRDQPGERHDARIIETHRAHRDGMRELHLRDALHGWLNRSLENFDSPAT